MQTPPQLVPLQVGFPLGTAGQGTHELPQLAGLLLETQAPLQRWKPVLQTMPQIPSLQSGTPLATAGQGVHDVPQEAGLLFETQELPQRWKPLTQTQRCWARSHSAFWPQSAVVVQPGLHTPSLTSQKVPGAQVPPVRQSSSHFPATQLWLAVQVTPHPPQFFGSLWVSVQVPLQRVRAGSGQGAGGASGGAASGAPSIDMLPSAATPSVVAPS